MLAWLYKFCYELPTWESWATPKEPTIPTQENIDFSGMETFAKEPNKQSNRGSDSND